MRLVDSHCHLDFPDFADERDAVLARARDAGVEAMVTIATTLDGFARARAIAEAHVTVFCSVGVHPHEAAGATGLRPETLLAMAEHPKVVGIGEAGLDYYYDRSPRDAQKQVFRAQIEAARRAGLPLIVHTRDAEDDTLALLREGVEEGGLTGVMHCFSGSRRLAEEAVALGFAISFSGIVTFRKAEELRAIARDVPEDRLLVETDAPYLAPVPNRGKRNEPAFVRFTAETLATERGVTPEAIGETTTRNFYRLFAKAAPARGTAA